MTKFLYSDKKPKDRIAVVIEHHMLPVVGPLGFSLLRKDLTLKRVVGDFEQLIAPGQFI